MSAQDERSPAETAHTLQPGDRVSVATRDTQQRRSVVEVPHSARWQVPLGDDDWQTTRVVLAADHPASKPLLVEAIDDTHAHAYTYEDGERTTERGRVETLRLSSVDSHADTSRTLEERVHGLLHAEGELPATDIKRILGCSQSVYDALRELEADGRIQSRRDPDDGRRHLYRAVTDEADRFTQNDTAGERPDAEIDIDGISLPVTLTEQRVRDAAGQHVTVAAVAEDLGITVGQARAVLFHLDEYAGISEARHDKRDRTDGEEGDVDE